MNTKEFFSSGAAKAYITRVSDGNIPPKVIDDMMESMQRYFETVIASEPLPGGDADKVKWLMMAFSAGFFDGQGKQEIRSLLKFRKVLNKTMIRLADEIREKQEARPKEPNHGSENNN